MAWQKTFSLTKRAKGCYLITEEILAQISHGLQGVQASRCSSLTFKFSSLIDISGWHAVSLHVCSVFFLSTFPDNNDESQKFQPAYLSSPHHQ
jgi:hypothetical protein